MARRKRHHRKHRRHSRKSTLIGRASKHCAGKGKRDRKKCMKAFFKNH